MSLQDSTFKTAHVLDNEIIKANDIEFAFEQLVENVSKATQMFLESNQDFVINGKVIPDIGMNVRVSPIYGVCKSTGKPFGRTETTDETIGFAGSTSGRIDIIEVQGNWETYDNQQRAFNDPDTDTQTYQYVDTKKLMKPVYQIKEGVEGSGIAPEVDEGWVKLAEVSIRAGVTTILASDIHNITADIAGLDNDDWTNEKDATYNIGYITDINSRFREQHNEDGTHKENVINAVSLDIGTGTNQINGNVLPIGGNVSIPTQTIAATDSICSVIIKAAAMITSLYNGYLQYGTYGFKGELKISSVFENDALKKPVSIVAAGDGTAVIKIDGNAVLSVDANGKLSTNGYQASSNNHIITKIVTDGLKTLIDNLDVRVTNIEETSDVTVYSNGTLSSGADGRYNVNQTVIYAATTQNVTLSGTQIIDGTTPADGSLILVKNQDDAKENGIYQYSSNSTWARSNDFLSPNDLKSQIFNIVNGTTNGGKMFYLPKVNFTDGSAFGTDEINFAEYFASIKAKANKLAMRDSAGRVKTETPSAADDAVNKGALLNLIYPVGSLYWTSKAPNNNGDPNILFGGTWVQIKDRFILAAGDTYSNGATGGSATVTLTVDQMPNHRHAYEPKGSIVGGSYTFKGTSSTTGDDYPDHTHNYTNTVISLSENILTSAGVGSTGIGYINDTQTSAGANTRHAHNYTPSGTIEVSTNPEFVGNGSTTNYEGGGQAHNNMPPYIVKFCWERTA